MNLTPLILGTRASDLALWQARRVKTQLEAAGHEVRLEEITTTGDRRQDTLISEIGDEAVFTKELDYALLEGRIQLAVHSLKDLPSRLPGGIVLAAVSARAAPFDAFVPHPSFGGALRDVPEGAVLATSSVRRRAQLKAWRPDLQVAPVRGNVDTRLEKLDASDWQGMILAVAGLERMGLEGRIREHIDPAIMIPAVGQGALGIACAAENASVAGRLRRTLHDEAAGVAARAERAFMQRIGGGCQVPTGAWARFEDGASRRREERLVLDGCVAALDGSQMLREQVTFAPDRAETAGRRLGEQLLEQGGKAILETIDPV